MTCRPVPVAGGIAIFCNRGERQRARCGVPGCSRWAEFECDHPIKTRKSGTCDAKLCPAHATKAGAERDLCPPHAKQKELF